MRNRNADSANLVRITVIRQLMGRRKSLFVASPARQIAQAVAWIKYCFV
jgi:hypothetical protein